MGRERAAGLSGLCLVLAAPQLELQELGVDHLTLFGMVARDERKQDSDVDLLATFSETKSPFLLKVVSIQQKISDFLGCPVDLGGKNCVKLHLKPYVKPDLIDIF